MKNKLKSVEEFHNAFGLGVANFPIAKLEASKIVLRHNLMAEENDALGDMLYILCGTILEHGMQHIIEDVFNEIQLSNMSKLGADGKPIYREDGKVLKGPNYFKPDIKKIINK